MRTTEPLTADAIEATDAALVIVLGERKVRIPWEDCSPRLASASEQQRREAQLSPGGYGIHWPSIDEDLSIGGLLRDAQQERPGT